MSNIHIINHHDDEKGGKIGGFSFQVWKRKEYKGRSRESQVVFWHTRAQREASEKGFWKFLDTENGGLYRMIVNPAGIDESKELQKAEWELVTRFWD